MQQQLRGNDPGSIVVRWNSAIWAKIS